MDCKNFVLELYTTAVTCLSGAVPVISGNMVKECQGRDFESVRIPLCMAIHWCWGTVRFSMDLDSVRSPQYFSFGRFLRVILFGALPEQFVWSCLYTSLRFFEHVQPWQSTFQHFDPKCMGSTYTTSDLLWLVTKCHQMSPNVTKAATKRSCCKACFSVFPRVRVSVTVSQILLVSCVQCTPAGTQQVTKNHYLADSLKDWERTSS